MMRVFVAVMRLEEMSHQANRTMMSGNNPGKNPSRMSCNGLVSSPNGTTIGVFSAIVVAARPQITIVPNVLNMLVMRFAFSPMMASIAFVPRRYPLLKQITVTAIMIAK